MSTNLHQLTTSYRAVQYKKRAQQTQIKQVIFDEDGRREFLTGFHKRKVARTEAARVKAKEKEKADRVEVRQQRRRALREQALKNATQLEKACGAISDDSDDEWHGISPRSEFGEVSRGEEYENEEALTTVTVVEDFDPDLIRHGPSHPKFYPEPAEHTPESNPNLRSKGTKIYYETKHARKKERTKQHDRKLEKGEQAGGKASRKLKR